MLSIKKLLLLFVSVFFSVAATDISEPRYLKQAQQATNNLGKALKKELQTALQTKGPVAAVQACNLSAPALSKQHSRPTEMSPNGVEVGRTSLKPRNPSNTPDQWEHRVLQKFEKQQKKGDKSTLFSYSEIVKENGKSVFRYMQAIPTSGVCLTCHGTQLKPELAAEIQRLYPEDKAKGYALDDIRGAFTVRIVMD